MVDLEKEEFLQRFDMRLHAMANMIASHEKYIVNYLCSYHKAKEYDKVIDKGFRELFQALAKTDNEIQERFEKLKKELVEGGIVE